MKFVRSMFGAMVAVALPVFKNLQQQYGTQDPATPQWADRKREIILTLNILEGYHDSLLSKSLYAFAQVANQFRTSSLFH